MKIYTFEELLEMQQEKIRESFRERGISQNSQDIFFESWRLGMEYMKDFPKWTPTYERMPENGQRVLCYLDNNGMECYTYYENNKDFAQLFKNHVVAWMPQPKAPYIKDEQAGD